MKRILIFFGLIFLPVAVLGDEFVPEFDSMKYIRCDFEETVYNQDGSVLTKSNQHRFFRLDDPYKKIYLQKEPIDHILYYGDDKIEFNLQSMTDDTIVMSHTILDRNSNKYFSESEITYDSFFGVKTAKAQGICKSLN